MLLWFDALPYLSHLLGLREGRLLRRVRGRIAIVCCSANRGSWDSLSEKTKALIQVSLSVRDHGRALGCAEVQRTTYLSLRPSVCLIA
jgi:hypothetical protein